MRRFLAVLAVVGACDGDVGTSSTDAGIDATPPDDPGPADVHFVVDTGADRHAISPWIYGANDDANSDWLRATRSGGNRMTAYNWENNASNAGTDYLNQNDAFLGGGETPGAAVMGLVDDAVARGVAVVVTVPIQGYVAADKDGGGDVNQTPDYLETRFHESRARKPGPLSASPDLGDGVVYQDEFVAAVEAALPAPRPAVFYCLDNEPDLWNSTHPRIHPQPAGYDELLGRGLEYAAAIKDVAPDALVFGPVSYGWNGYVNLQDAPDGGGRDFLDFYLDGFAAADDGRRLLDVLDLHWYPEAQGAGQRITADAGGGELGEARKQAPRSLWDPTYTETSWITEFSTLGPIALLPRLKDKIATRYPGTKLAFTEYYYGGGDDVSGGIAQADVLGIFGREDVFAAMLWHIGGSSDRFIHGAFRLYQAFGSTSVRATTDDVEATSVYASVEGDEVLVVAINKTTAPTTAAVQLTHGATLKTVAPLRMTDGEPQAGEPFALTLHNAFVVTLPAESVTLFRLSP